MGRSLVRFACSLLEVKGQVQTGFGAVEPANPRSVIGESGFGEAPGVLLLLRRNALFVFLFLAVVTFDGGIAGGRSSARIPPLPSQIPERRTQTVKAHPPDDLNIDDVDWLGLPSVLI